MRQTFNPVTQTVIQLHNTSLAPTLQQWCRNAIFQSVTLKRVDQIANLPIPGKVADRISKVGLEDFYIDPSHLNSTNHLKRMYPATCLFDNSRVILKIVPSGTQVNTKHPSFLVAFEEGDVQCCIYQKTDTLQEIIEAYRETGTQVGDKMAWKVVQEFCHWVLLHASGHSGKLSTSVINIDKDGQVFFDLTESEQGQQDITAMEVGEPQPVYEAPEILTRNDPDEQAFVWSLGCVIYEMLSLQPAYYDADGTNPFAVYMKIIQGELPPDNLRGGRALADLVWACLVVNPAARPTIRDILSIADSKLH